MRCDLLIAQKDKSTAGTDMTCQILFDQFLDVSAVLRACCASVHSFLVWAGAGVRELAGGLATTGSGTGVDGAVGAAGCGANGFPKGAGTAGGRTVVTSKGLAARPFLEPESDFGEGGLRGAKHLIKEVSHRRNEHFSLEAAEHFNDRLQQCSGDDPLLVNSDIQPRSLGERVINLDDLHLPKPPGK
ncbi:hypothetical protein PAPYR_11532 [Paratrimastix pyriformis]|uniref:Uncharacterized protein n=1 Tax=Paratrimastix pyriformis TaxID=342808 RepID=A0ABQ8U3J0_9EUKA|nr:hypothetical protein PAPYR_11532 [Paratrimastix pyriformis]